jgi:hypothetical protein
LIFIKTRSGRYLRVESIHGFAVEEEKMEIDGRKRLVYEVIAYLPQPLLPAVLGIYTTEEKAEEKLDQLIHSILESKGNVLIKLESEI